jgi:predicted nucleic acid-binding protein
MDVRELDAALGDAHRAFVDSSACIAYHNTTELVHPLARHLFARVASPSDPLGAYISVVSVAEMLIRPIRAGGHDLTLVTDFIRGFPNLTVLDVTLDVANQAATIRALTRLSMPDALLVGTALLTGCEAIFTNDREWARRLAPLFSQFRWIYLGR